MERQAPCLMLITDRRRSRLPLVEAVRHAVAAGVDAVQLREKDLDGRELYRLALELRLVTAGRSVLIVNSRPDVALAVEADGVHLPEGGLPLEAVHRLAPPGFLAGRSVHSVAGARQAQREGASYVQLGTIFATQSKPGKAADGIELVRAAASELTIPCLGVGGIDETNAASVIAAGAQGVSVISAILQAEEIEAAVQRLRRAMAAESPAASVSSMSCPLH